MSDGARSIYRNNFLYWGLIVYFFCVFAFPTPKSGLAAVQVPSFALLLLLLVQVIFPQFRFSRRANLIAVIVILTLAILSTGLIPPPVFP